MKKIILTLSAGLLITGAANALVLDGETSDAQVLSTGAGDQGSGSVFTQAAAEPLAVGRTSAGTGRNSTAVFVFELPDFGAVANPFLTSTLTFNLVSNSGNYGADLYGIDSRAAATVLSSDFYMGTAVDGSSDVTLLQASVLTTGSANGAVTSADITSWLNNQYDSGAGVGESVFLRLSAHVASGVFDTDNGFTVASADALSGGPFLTYTVPEPGSFALIAGFFGLGYVMTRRRQA